jgi:hypothetical protein
LRGGNSFNSLAPHPHCLHAFPVCQEEESAWR